MNNSGNVYEEYMYKNYVIRVISNYTNGELYFAANDICKALGLKDYEASARYYAGENRLQSMICTGVGWKRANVLDVSDLLLLLAWIQKSNPKKNEFEHWLHYIFHI